MPQRGKLQNSCTFGIALSVLQRLKRRSCLPDGSGDVDSRSTARYRKKTNSTVIRLVVSGIGQQLPTKSNMSACYQLAYGIGTSFGSPISIGIHQIEHGQCAMRRQLVSMSRESYLTQKERRLPI